MWLVAGLNHQQCDGRLRKLEQARGVFHVRSHDPFNGADASFEGSEVCSGPAQCRLRTSGGPRPLQLNGREGRTGKTPWPGHKGKPVGATRRHADAVGRWSDERHVRHLGCRAKRPHNGGTVCLLMVGRGVGIKPTATIDWFH